MLQSFFDEHNALVRLFRTALEQMPSDDFTIVIKAVKTPAGEHERRYNAPTINEVAILIVGEDCNSRDIVIRRRNGTIQRVSETHRSYDALQYPVLFWQGEDGYHFNIKMIEPEKPEEDVKKVSAMNYYAYRLMIRPDACNHILKCRLIFHQYLKITPDQIDEIILAEIPDSNIDPGFFEVISKNMVHGPCGTINKDSPYMKDGKCTKRYPKDMHTDSITGNDGYPQYRRRSIDNGEKSITVKVKNFDFEVDNRWIVPYSPLLSKTFKAHINFEYCNSVKSIKYIFKYVTKGSDMAVFGIEDANTPTDEIDRYKLGRYINSNEAAWRIFAFLIHECYPTVLHLAVHLENGQRTTKNIVYPHALT
ncbi:hypothetical protein TKK_0004696 [Trichogramma kaykai]